jgi:hypothetical protein
LNKKAGQEPQLTASAEAAETSEHFRRHVGALQVEWPRTSRMRSTLAAIIKSASSDITIEIEAFCDSIG